MYSAIIHTHTSFSGSFTHIRACSIACISHTKPPVKITYFETYVSRRLYNSLTTYQISNKSNMY